MSSPVQFIGINYFPPSPIDVQSTSQPQPPGPTPWESGAASPLSEDYVVVGVPTFPPKIPCVCFLGVSLPHLPLQTPYPPVLCSVQLTLERSTRKARRGGVPVSSYHFGPPGRDSVYYTPPMGRIGVHHPREIVRVERDYTGGEIVQFSSVYPMELEGRVSPFFFFWQIYNVMRHCWYFFIYSCRSLLGSSWKASTLSTRSLSRLIAYGVRYLTMV
jgi:hypothetical protein